MSQRASLLSAQIAAGLQHRHDIVAGSEFAEDRGFLGQVAQARTCARVHGHQGDVPARELDGPGDPRRSVPTIR